MVGLVTERDFLVIEKVFPGMKNLYANLTRKPRTFLELEWQYLHKKCASRKRSKRKNPRN